MVMCQTGRDAGRKRTALLVICLSVLVTVLAVVAIASRVLPGTSRDFSGRLSLGVGDLMTLALSTNSDGTADLAYVQNGEELGMFSGSFERVGEVDGSVEYLLTIRSVSSRGERQSASEIDEMNASQGFIARLDGSTIRFVIPERVPEGDIKGAWELDVSQLAHYSMSSINPDSSLNQEGSATPMVFAMNVLDDGSIDISLETGVEIPSDGVYEETLTQAVGECRMSGDGEFQVLMHNVDVSTVGDSVLTTPLKRADLLEGASFSLTYDSHAD